MTFLAVTLACSLVILGTLALGMLVVLSMEYLLGRLS